MVVVSGRMVLRWCRVNEWMICSGYGIAWSWVWRKKGLHNIGVSAHCN